MKSEIHFCREAIGNQCDKVLKEISIIGRICSLAKLRLNQNYTDNANRDVPLTLENVLYF